MEPSRKKTKRGSSLTSLSSDVSSETPVGGSEEGRKQPKPRHPNFNRWEDTTLCRSWGNASCDPLLGNNQRGTAFWKKVHELYCVAHSLTDISLKENPNTRTMDQLQNRFKGIQTAIQIFNVHYRHIVAESPSGVPEDEYIDLACDRYKLVQGSKFRFKYLVPTLHAIVKFSPENETVLQEHQLVDQNNFPVNGEGGVIMVDSQGRDVVVTPLNPGRTNMAGSVMGSHLRRPIGTKRAKAAAIAAREPAARARIVGEAVPEPPPFIPGAAAAVADRLTVTLGKIFSGGKRKDEFDIKTKIWETMLYYKKHVSARRVAEQMWSYQDTPAEEGLAEGEVEDQQQGEEEEEEEEVEEEEEEDVEEEEEDEVQFVATTTAGEVTASPDTAARRQRRVLQEEEDEEEEASSVNLLEAEEPAGAPQECHPEEDDDCSESSGSETILPPPPKPVFPAILPLYTNKPPFDRVSMNKKNKKKRGPTGPPAGTTVVEGGNKSSRPGLVAAAGRRPRALPSAARLPVEEFGTIDVNTQALMDFNTQALMEISSKEHTHGSRLPPGNLRRSSTGQPRF